MRNKIYMFNLMYLNINIYILSMTQEKNYGIFYVK